MRVARAGQRLASRVSGEFDTSIDGAVHGNAGLPIVLSAGVPASRHTIPSRKTKVTALEKALRMIILVSV